jgi:hypothetical protein
MINFKQEELIKELVKDIEKKFPEVEFINITPSPENPNELWINMRVPDDEDREFELVEFSSNKTMDILLEYGYHFLVMPTRNSESATFGPSIELSMEEI